MGYDLRGVPLTGVLLTNPMLTLRRSRLPKMGLTYIEISPLP